MKKVSQKWCEKDALTLAPKLIGKILCHEDVCGRIVETEAYMEDAASHAVKSPKRGRLMRETHGHWYVYFTYGMHYCINITCGKNTTGGVLIRALEPISGLKTMQKRRKTTTETNLTSGPAKICQALNITTDFAGLPLQERIELFHGEPKGGIVACERIGISGDKHLPWRFYEKDNPHVSKK